MRVYLPVSPRELSSLHRTGTLEVPADREAYAVTADVCRALDLGAEDEEAEYAVLGLAAQAAVILAGASGRRAVVVCEVEAQELGDARVRVAGELTRRRVQSLHVDDDEAVDLVRAALAGDGDAARALEDHDLGWWATQELDVVVGLLDVT